MIRLFPQPLFRRLGLLLLAALLVVPFLGAHHFLPLATFHQEWLAGLLGLLIVAALLLDNDSTPWEIPSIVLLPLALLLAVWLQWFAGIGVLFETACLASLYMMWASLVMIGVCRLERLHGRDTLAGAIGISVLVGALLLCGTAIVQKAFPGLGLPWIFPYRGIVEGNIAQSNSFADYLWIGIAAALYLHVQARIGSTVFIASVLPLLTCSLLSGSRSVYFYAVALTLWLLIFARTRNVAGGRRRALLCAATLLPLLFAVQGLLTVGGTSVSSAQRLASYGSYDPVRLTLWHAAFEMFIEHPFLGVGFDGFSREFFARIEQFPINGTGIPEHSHNLLTEIAAEFGLLGLVPLIAIGVFWIWQQARKRIDDATWFAFGTLLILGIHSMLEYPLWYAHFLAIAAAMLALTDGRRVALAIDRRRQWLVGLVIVASLIVLGNWKFEYSALEEAANGRDANGAAIHPDARREQLLLSYKTTLWRPYAALQFAAQMPIENQDVDGRLTLMQEATYFSPIRQAVFRQAAILLIGGQKEAAEITLRRAMAAYPGDIPTALTLYENSSEAATLRPLSEMLRQRSF